MPVEADSAAGVEVVQQHVFFGQRVMVGRNVAPVHHQLRITVGLRQIAKHLIVGTILLHDEKHVLYPERRQIRDPSRAFKLRAVRGRYLPRTGCDLSR